MEAPSATPGNREAHRRPRVLPSPLRDSSQMMMTAGTKKRKESHGRNAAARAEKRRASVSAYRRDGEIGAHPLGCGIVCRIA